MIVSIKGLSNATIIKVELEKMLGYSGTDFQEAVMSSIKSDKKYTIVDLSKVTFISSWGIGILIHGYTTVINQHGSFTLAAVPEIVSGALQKTKLDTIFKKFDSVDEALKS